MSSNIVLNTRHHKCNSDYFDLISKASLTVALENLQQIPDYRTSSLIDCESLARAFDLKTVSCKYEGDRFGGGSFKPLGVANAAMEITKRVIEKASSLRVTSSDLFKDSHNSYVAHLTFTCATTGNHGYALAWIAGKLGAQSRIYCPADTTRYRKDRIASLGAEVITVPGGFDDAVEMCSRESKAMGHIVVSNLIQEGFEDIPQLIMNGYSVLAAEVLSQIKSPITHIFVGGGGGRLAASITAFFKIRQWQNFPKVIVVEPEHSDCISNSIKQGELMHASVKGRTIMTGLVVAKPSSVSWPVLKDYVFASLVIPDEAAVKTLIELDKGALGHELLPIGETGVAALAGFLEVMREESSRRILGIDSSSHVLIVACEGVTDPNLLDSIVSNATGEFL